MNCSRSRSLVEDVTRHWKIDQIAATASVTMRPDITAVTANSWSARKCCTRPVSAQPARRAGQSVYRTDRAAATSRGREVMSSVDRRARCADRAGDSRGRGAHCGNTIDHSDAGRNIRLCASRRPCSCRDCCRRSGRWPTPSTVCIGPGMVLSQVGASVSAGAGQYLRGLVHRGQAGFDVARALVAGPDGFVLGVIWSGAGG